MKKRIEIDSVAIGRPESVYFIAEIGKNHNGDLRMAKTLIEAAVAARVSAVKFQCYSVDTLLHKGGVAAEPDLEYLKKCALSDDDFRELKRFCDVLGVTFLATPEDYKYVDLLEELEVPAYKVSSLNITNFPLLRHIASKKKPVILSTGMSTLHEVVGAQKALEPCSIALLHCVSRYPAGLATVNLRAMTTMREKFKCPVGFSDHTLYAAASPLAVVAGAELIEAHITLDNDLYGPDHSFSLTPKKLRHRLEQIRIMTSMLGTDLKKPHYTENINGYVEQKRRACVAARDIQEGEIFREDMIVCLCPGGPDILGAEKYYNLTEGKYKAAEFITKGTPIQRKMVEWAIKRERRGS